MLSHLCPTSVPPRPFWLYQSLTGTDSISKLWGGVQGRERWMLSHLCPTSVPPRTFLAVSKSNGDRQYIKVGGGYRDVNAGCCPTSAPPLSHLEPFWLYQSLTGTDSISKLWGGVQGRERWMLSHLCPTSVPPRTFLAVSKSNGDRQYIKVGGGDRDVNAGCCPTSAPPSTSGGARRGSRPPRSMCTGQNSEVKCYQK